MIKPDDDTLLEMAQKISQQQGAKEWDLLDEEMHSYYLKQARELWEVMFADASPLGGWWLGKIVEDPKVEMLFILPKVQAHPGILLKATETPGEITTVSHHTNRNFGKNGETTHFQVSKIGKTT